MFFSQLHYIQRAYADSIGVKTEGNQTLNQVKQKHANRRMDGQTGEQSNI